MNLTKISWYPLSIHPENNEFSKSFAIVTNQPCQLYKYSTQPEILISVTQLR